VTLAISTSGEAPALAGILRETADAILPPDLERWSACASELRARWKRDAVPMTERRPQLVAALKALYP
jgi:uroporphyrin-III C-methyltransferase/precorrin-2 dehydrogenase/sirohydrochlorin ferrochelatase